MNPVFTFPRAAAPFLPMTSGAFAASEGKRKRLPYRLEVAPMGELNLDEGKLVAADPFTGLRYEGNLFVRVPPGRHVLGQTWVHFDDEEGGQTSSRVAYLSVIFNPAKIGARRKWQEAQRAQDKDPSVPMAQLRVLHPTRDGRPLSIRESTPEALPEEVGVHVRTGALALVGLESLALGLPPDSFTHGHRPDALDWYDTYFANDVPGSWLDRLDQDQDLRAGALNLGLPNDVNLRLAISHAGWGQPSYLMIGEYATAEEGDRARPVEELIAVHLDFRALPRPDRQPSVPLGWAS